MRARRGVEPAGPYDRGADADGPAQLLDTAPGETGNLPGAREPGRGLHGPRPTGTDGAGVGDLVEDPGPDGDRAHAVGQRVVELDQHRERAARLPGQQVHLPGRQAPFEWPLHQLTGDRDGPGGEVAVGDADLMHMTPYVEVLGHGPGRTADGQQDVPYVHPQPSDRRGAGGEQFEDTLAALSARSRGEAGEGAEMHRMSGGLEMPERQIEGARSSLLKGVLLS